MPELPEVETICRGLRGCVPGRRIVRVRVVEPRLRRPVDSHFSSRLRGKKIIDVGRRGKYIMLFLQGDEVWMIHLGMSGKLIYVPSERPRERHDHITALLDNGYELRYHDPRRFGLSLLADRAGLEELPELRRLGLDPLDPRFGADYLYAFAHGSVRRIRDLLIDQTVVAGLGNIYANEILFRAGIRPTTRARLLGRGRVTRIAEVMPEVLEEAIRRRGTSFSDYRDGEDRPGGFQHHLRVYGRGGRGCLACGRSILRVRLGNRSAFFCPSCQK